MVMDAMGCTSGEVGRCHAAVAGAGPFPRPPEVEALTRDVLRELSEIARCEAAVDASLQARTKGSTDPDCRPARLIWNRPGPASMRFLRALLSEPVALHA